MYLFFDTETTGLPLSWSAPVEYTDNWPRMVQAAWMLYDDDGNKIFDKNYIIKPQGFIIPENSVKIHGITTQKAIQEGCPLCNVLQEFRKMVIAADCLVGHNISFDEKIVGAEFLRNGMENYLENKNTICTMRGSAEFCAIRNQYGYKWPKLSELHYRLFNSEFEDAHNAATDIRITAKCFWEMRQRGLI